MSSIMTRGPKSHYRPKERLCVSITLTRLGREILDAAARRTGESRSDVVENLLRRHGPTVVFDEVDDDVTELTA